MWFEMTRIFEKKKNLTGGYAFAVDGKQNQHGRKQHTNT